MLSLSPGTVCIEERFTVPSVYTTLLISVLLDRRGRSIDNDIKEDNKSKKANYLFPLNPILFRWTKTTLYYMMCSAFVS